MQIAAPTSMQISRFTARAVALAFLACFACALTGTGLPASTAVSGKAAFANHKTGVATIPRQGASARLSAAPKRESAKSPLSGVALGLPGYELAAISGDSAGDRAPSTSPTPSIPRTAHLPRGPPALDV
jgi:hypothetical protein